MPAASFQLPKASRRWYPLAWRESAAAGRTKQLRMAECIETSRLAVRQAPATSQGAADEVLSVLDQWAATDSSEAATPELMLELYDAEVCSSGYRRSPAVRRRRRDRAVLREQEFANFPQRRVSFIDPIVRVYGDTATATGLYRFE